MWVPKRERDGVIVRRGKHLLKHMSWCVKRLLHYRAGEAEYCALIRGTCTSLGIPSRCQDWMIHGSIDVHSDSSARSVARRRGGGRLRHLQTRLSRLQSRVALGHLMLDVVAGEQNPADTHASTARSQDSRVVGTCWSEMVAAVTMMGQQQQQTRDVSYG